MFQNIKYSAIIDNYCFLFTNMMSDLDRFELFTYVAQLGSLTQAALALGMAKPSLSKQIKRLEAELKIDLFSRQAQRLQLTEPGKLLLAHCLRLKKELDDVRTICQQFIEEPEGSLHIVVFEYFAKQLIFPKLNQFLERYPKLNLNITIAEKIPDFEREQIDLAVGFSLPAALDIVRKSITTTRYILCASPGYFKNHPMPKQLSDLKNHRYIGHSSRLENQALKLKHPYNLTIKPYLLLNSVAGMIECAKQGLGVIQLPSYLLCDSIKNGELIQLFAYLQATDQAVYYYYPKYRYIQPKVRKFIDYFLS
jgi:DNA-binding transcriptional LysR family regulator